MLETLTIISKIVWITFGVVCIGATIWTGVLGNKYMKMFYKSFEEDEA